MRAHAVAAAVEAIARCYSLLFGAPLKHSAVARERCRRFDRGSVTHYSTCHFLLGLMLSVSLPFPSFGSAAPASDSCIDILHLTQQLQRARDIGASIIIGAFAAGALSDSTHPAPPLHTIYSFERQRGAS